VGQGVSNNSLQAERSLNRGRRGYLESKHKNSRPVKRLIGQGRAQSSYNLYQGKNVPANGTKRFEREGKGLEVGRGWPLLDWTR